MPRFKLLQTIDRVNLVAVATPAPVADPAAAPARLDVQPEFAGHDFEGRFRFVVPAYTTGTHNVLAGLHVSLFEKDGAGVLVAPIPVDPAEIVLAPLHYSTDTSALQAGGPVVVDATAAPEGNYSAALVAE